MSNLQNNIFQNKLKELEKRLGTSLSGLDLGDEDEENESTVADLPTNFNKKPSNKPSIEPQDIALPSWREYYDEADVYEHPDTSYKFQTYFSQPTFNPDSEQDRLNPVVFITHHGAGSSGLTFARLCSSIPKMCERDSLENYPGLLSFDMRGHGNTNILNADEPISELSSQLSIENLCNDLIFILSEFYRRNFTSVPKISPSFFLVGHSLGGSVLTKVIHQYEQKPEQSVLPTEIRNAIKGLVMIDIVEDTAIKALSAMNGYLRSMPKMFPTIKKAVDWHMNSGLLHNYKSALISVPSLLTKSHGMYRWVIDLSRTEQYWTDWFTSLSSQFTGISGRVSKLLILANNDYLDKDLMIGQMQGKYQLIVFHNNQLELQQTLTTATRTIETEDSDNLGHFIQEDIPEKVAASLLEFVERNDRSSFLSQANSNVSSQMEFLNKLNAKWGVKK